VAYQKKKKKEGGQFCGPEVAEGEMLKRTARRHKRKTGQQKKNHGLGSYEGADE